MEPEPVLDADNCPSLDRRDRVSAGLLAWPLTAALGVLCLWELLTWAPNYLTWPLWADHDVFATAATSWDRGVLPYRDFVGNNFPGTIYLFWMFGKLFGFGWALGPSMYGFDAALVVVLGAVLVFWSILRFGRALPGLIGYAGFLGYYLALDYSQAAQRDWQGPVLVVLGLLLVQASGGRVGRTIAALLAAAGLLIRPQSILLLPAQAMAVAAEARRKEKSAALAVAEWAAIVAAGVALGFLPLILSGLMGDFRDSLRVVTYGGKYNMVTATRFAEQMLVQLQPLRVDIVPLGIALLASRASTRTRAAAGPWIVAFLGVLLYRPMSPHPHTYLTHPLMLVWFILAAILASLILDRDELSASIRLAAVLMLIGLVGVSVKPRFSNPNGSREAYTVLKLHREPGPKPTGYASNPDVVAAGYYEWKDYRDVLDYLRAETSEATKVANCLKFVPAINGPTARLSPFPAESVAWLIVVREDAEESFAESLERATDSVVVWAPSESDLPKAPKLPRIEAAIRAKYRPSKKFGIIEVWRRAKGVTP